MSARVCFVALGVGERACGPGVPVVATGTEPEAHQGRNRRLPGRLSHILR